jgi:hypothetical protein
MIDVKKPEHGNVLDVSVTGRLTRDDYEHFAPAVDRLIHEHGKVRIVFDMHGFHGWTPGALWEDIKFDARHFRDIERLAFIGERKWEAGMAAFCKPFTSAAIRYFDREQADEARQWVRS